MKIHLLAATAAIMMGFIVNLTSLAWGILSITIVMVLAAESINTAVERAVDLVGPETHPLAKAAKDAAAGAVLLTAINAVVIAFILFGPYLMNVFQYL
jgi:Diacylglycerol kinase